MASPLASPSSSQSPDYDNELQRQLRRDMGMLTINMDGPPEAVSASTSSSSLVSDKPLPPHPASATSTQQSTPRSVQMDVPEIPPFKGNSQGQRVPSHSTPVKSNPLAEAAPTPPSFPSPAPDNPNGELDALNNVMFPALEEALRRRQARLEQTYPTNQTATPSAKQQRAEMAHEKLRKLVYKMAHVCKEIDQLDKAEPVGMGQDVGNFLEGLLEEILYRVEPLEEEAQ
ncbi:hypothetical protein Golomagni_07865, partial [Golovinomyces magnicellulatus]